MKLYSENKDYKLYQGNMLDMLEVIEPNTIDSVVCDPPYELNFMSKSWDNSGIAFQPDTWKKCYEVLKPGGYLLAFGGSRTFHRIACAIEDAGFEIRDTIMWLYGCYSADTQVLTNEGWKYFYELNKNEKVMQWNKGTNKLSWVKPLNYFEYDIEDEMINLQNRHTNQLITKNHKVVCDIKKNHKKYNNYFDFVEAKGIKKTDAVKLPLASYYYGDINYEYAYIIGWWLTDAWKHQDGKAVCFSQSKPKTLEKLKKELDRLKALGKCNYSEYQRHDGNSNHNIEHSFYVTGEMVDYLLKNFNDREFKKEFIELNKESKELLLEGLMDGDGTCRDNEYSKVFWSKKEQRNDILSALLTTMGYRNYINYNKGHCGVVFNIKHSTTEIQYKHKKENIMYKGKVYCLQTETGAFVVRRNGKPFISGNSGFPKSMDISKQIDKKPQANRTIEFKKWLKEKIDNCGKSYKQINDECGFTASSYSKTDFKDNWSINHPNKEKWLKMKEVIGITENNYDWICENNVEERGYIEPTGGLAGGSGNTVGCYAGKQLSNNAIDSKAKQWQGWGTALKPSFEPIIVARKPFKGSLVDNVIEYGVGGINIDECRVGTIDTMKEQKRGKTIFEGGCKANAIYTPNKTGRFPANTILTYDETDFDEVCGGFPNTKSQKRSAKYNKDTVYTNTYTPVKSDYRDDNTYDDSGSASKYFYCAKASKKDRDEGLEEFEEKKTGELQGGRKEGSAGSIMLNADGTTRVNPYAGTGTPKKNSHPTVKPTELMQYLVRLVSPNGGTILDPFNGSGSTGKAVMYENKERNKNYKYIGIELTEEYLPIAKARIEYVCGEPVKETLDLSDLD